ncbi:unnamed protein product [Cochlearia groenlandica]
MAKNRAEIYVTFVLVLIVVGSVLLAIEARPFKDGSRDLMQLRDSHVFNGSAMSSFKPVEPFVKDLSWLATVKESGPSPGVGHHGAKGHKSFKDFGHSLGVGH